METKQKVDCFTRDFIKERRWTNNRYDLMPPPLDDDSTPKFRDSALIKDVKEILHLFWVFKKLFISVRCF